MSAHQLVDWNRLRACLRTDIFLRNDVTGENAVWLMNGTNIATAASLPTVSTNWHFLISDFNSDGITDIFSDFNDDGRTDIFWRNNVTEENAAWEVGKHKKSNKR